MTLGIVVAFLTLAFALIALGGLLAASEAAINSLSRAELEDFAAHHRRSASALRAIAHDPGAHMNATNFFRVIAETTSAVLVTLTLAFTIDELWLALIVSALVMTAVSFVLVGSSPRSVGRHHPEGILAFAAPLIRGVRVVLGPAAHGLVSLGDRVTPGRPRSAGISNEQQLLSMVDQAAEQDLLEDDDRELIHSIFEFNETLVREVMLPRTDMVTVDSSATLASAMEILMQSRHSRLPVVREDADNIEGILYLRDVSKALFRHPDTLEVTPVTQLMKPAVFVPESQKVDSLLKQMQLESNHLAMVVDEYGGIAGLVTLEDLLEELVGEILDEHDRSREPIEDLGGGLYRVNARVPIDDLGELFGIDLDDDEVDSVGGLFAKVHGRLPTVGDEVRAGGLILVAERTEGRGKMLSTITARADDHLTAIHDAGDQPENRTAHDTD
ncbi:hemolysin family protein [Klugiella xanthotipulae]|uniref:CBS domain containing-hemolysin-like protein n=1 Tax=Klugiella xanthotipulae TaxID=244735 RepID=A0A543HSE8_9MICO|nr:hemolysin family protein [Klugiella xanthotipulae]TQM61266.1 CBS domain containing-hemolysin-like protein [Klugiella xanthotipulae]